MNAPAAALPFQIASRVSTRQSFQIPSTALGVAPVVPLGTPVQIPAVGYLKSITLEVTLTAVGGAPTLQADAPWNIISQLTFKNSAGQNLIAPLTGYELFLVNKYGGQASGIASAFGILADPKQGRQYAAPGAGPIHFFIDVPLEIDPSSGLGAIPALASNRSYQLEITLSALATIFASVPTSASVTIDATANYWDAPVGVTPGGVTQVTEPFGLGTTSLWQKETPPVAPGDQLTKSNNVGNIIRNLIFVLRTGAGVRTDADFPSISELYIDNNPLFRFKKTEWQQLMVDWFGYTATALDSVGGLDTGVYVIPFSQLAGGIVNDPNNSRAQLLATLDATLLQLKGYNYGASASALTILTQAVTTPNTGFVYSK